MENKYSLYLLLFFVMKLISQETISPFVTDYSKYSFTPNNSRIDGFIDTPDFISSDYPLLYEFNQYAYYLDVFGDNAIQLSNYSRLYSCHGYAWDMSENPENEPISFEESRIPVYWNDGSYVKVNSFSNDGSTQISTSFAKIVYHSYNPRYNQHTLHSAITLNDPEWLISKWGYGFLFKHKLRSCPYDCLFPGREDLEMLALSFDVYIRAAQISNFNKETVPENPTDFYKIVPEEDIELTVEFNNPTEGINNKINKVELYYKADNDPDENKVLISTLNSAGDGLPFVFKWNTNNMPGISLGNKYEFISTIYYQNEENTIGDDRIHIEFVPRKIVIERETTEAFMIYDFENAQNPYLSGKFYHEDGINNKDFAIPAYNDVELYDVKWCEDHGSEQGVFAGVYPSSLFAPVNSYVWTTDKWPESKSKDEINSLFGNAEILNKSIKDSVKTLSKDFSAMTWYFDFTGSQLKLRPGLYRFCGNAYKKSDYPAILTKMADTDTLTMLIPSWKMKTEQDLRFNKERVHFRKNDDIEVCIWRPISGLKSNNTSVYLYSENKEQLLKTETISYTDSLGISKIVKFTTNDLAYGYYTIVAKEKDYITGRDITYEKEIQVCPFYVRWENGGLWPSDWPGTNDNFWRIATFDNLNPAIKSHCLKNYFDLKLYSSMDTQQNSPSVILEKPYDAFMQIFIGLERFNNIFLDLLAEYTASISVDNKATWTKLKTATPEEWSSYVWPSELDRWCFLNAETTIQYTGQPIYIKLTGKSQGISRDSVIEGVCYDEIMIAYTKEALLQPPPIKTVEAVTIGKFNAVKLTWEHSPDFATPRYYRVYRDGNLIADNIVDDNYSDATIIGGKTYNYVVTLFDYNRAYFGDLAYESPKAGNSVDFYTGDLPTPINFQLHTGDGLEYNVVRLTWLSPVKTLSKYNVYRDNILIGSTTLQNYTDIAPHEGLFNYFVTAVYIDPPGESNPTETLSAVIKRADSFFTEDFENEGIIPLNWSQTGDLNWIFTELSPTGISSADGGYFAYLGNELPSSTYSASLATQSLDLALYKEAYLSLQCLCSKSLAVPIPPVLNIKIRDNIGNKEKIIYSFSSMFPEWIPIDSILIDPLYLTANCQFIFEGKLNSSDTNSIICIDNLYAAGTPKILPPSFINIERKTDSIVLSWPAVEGASSYKIYRSERHKSDFQLIATVPETSYTDYGTDKTNIEKMYFYRIESILGLKQTRRSR